MTTHQGSPRSNQGTKDTKRPCYHPLSNTPSPERLRSRLTVAGKLLVTAALCVAVLVVIDRATRLQQLQHDVQIRCNAAAAMEEIGASSGTYDDRREQMIEILEAQFAEVEL